MLFSGLLFLTLFLPVTLLVYYVVPDNWKNPVLLAASLFFYAWGEPVYIILMVISIVFNWYMGLTLKYADESDHRGRRYLLWSGVTFNLLILGYFKYAAFFITTINQIFHISITVPELSLPIGISFYTFQALGYLADVYRGKVKAQKNLISFGVYIACFPQLIAGPIVSYSEIEEKINHPNLRRFSFKRLGGGASLFIVGLAKKVLIANQVGEIYNSYYQSGNFSCLGYYLAALCFAFQIYFDFSGYSDMALGLGRMLGFFFDKNFNYPYLSCSVTEFWRRWHISLGSWFREYVYIPLGGNRVPVWRHICNIFIVWLLTGLWHGASWNFVIWGLYYGALLLLEKYLFGKYLNQLPFLGWLVTSVAVFYGWVIFAADGSFAEFLEIAKGLFGIGVPFTNCWVSGKFPHALRMILICLIGMTDLPFRFHKMLMDYRSHEHAFRKGATLSLVLVSRILMLAASIAFLIYDSYNPFLYFRF